MLSDGAVSVGLTSCGFGSLGDTQAVADSRAIALNAIRRCQAVLTRSAPEACRAFDIAIAALLGVYALTVGLACAARAVFEAELAIRAVGVLDAVGRSFTVPAAFVRVTRPRAGAIVVGQALAVGGDFTAQIGAHIWSSEGTSAGSATQGGDHCSNNQWLERFHRNRLQSSGMSEPEIPGSAALIEQHLCQQRITTSK